MGTILEEIYERMKRFHSKYCDYPCFTIMDVANAVICLYLDKPLIKENQGTTIITQWGTFGNLSYSHFIDALYLILEDMKEEMKSNGN